jgi:soluble lytic murein transglycosylase
MNRDNLLDNPKIYLDKLQKNTYFSKSSEIFKTASNLYFSLLKQEKSTPQEKKFFKAFQLNMYRFSANYIDELVMKHWKILDLKKSEKLSSSFLNLYKGHPLYPKVLYNLARIQEDSKHYDQALKNYKQLLKKSDDPAYAELASFRSAWVMHLNKKAKKAAPLFQEYLNQYPDGKYASTSEYHLLKYTHHKDKSLEKNSVEKFIEKYPLNFYSVVLTDEYHINEDVLLSTLSSKKISDILTDQFRNFKLDIKNIMRLNCYRELIELDLKSDALKVLKGFSFDENNELFMYYLANEFYKNNNTHGESIFLIRLFNADKLRSFIPWSSLFPDFRRELIQEQINHLQIRLPSLLVLSIIRQESAFDPEARSSANAFGLMQLTEGTAKGTAALLGLNTFNLSKEEDNLKLGIKTISELLNKYNGRLDYALSAYNAGESITDVWIEIRGHLDPIEFIESIPYQETRTYIKNILRNYAIYRLLYEKNHGPLIFYSSK